MDQQHRVDGNAAAGAFGEALGLDVTIVTVTCAGCGQTGKFAECHVYGSAPGIVVRCPGCEAITARPVRTSDKVWIDFQGSRSWRIPSITS